MKEGLGGRNHDFLSNRMVTGPFSEGQHAFLFRTSAGFSGQVMNNDRGDEENHDTLGLASLWKMKSNDIRVCGKAWIMTLRNRAVMI